MKNLALAVLVFTMALGCRKEASAPEPEEEMIVSYSDANISVRDFKAEKRDESIVVSFKTNYERNLKEIEVLSGTDQSNLCSIYREMKNENSTQTLSYSIVDKPKANPTMYYLIKYTANNGDWAFTPLYKCQVQ